MYLYSFIRPISLSFPSSRLSPYTDMSPSAFALFFAITIGQSLAQSTATYLSEFPECAQQPLVQGIEDSGCVVTDTDCICSSQRLLQNIATAIVGNCDAIDQASKFETGCLSTGPAAESMSKSFSENCWTNMSKRLPNDVGFNAVLTTRH